MPKIRIAAAGMAHDHLWSNLKQAQALEDVEVVAGSDPNPALRSRFQERTGVERVYADHEGMLDRERPDAVFVFSSSAEHRELVEMAAARGIHAMVEKPMAATLEQADAMVLAARRGGTVLMVNWPTAWSANLRTAHRLAREGRVGEIWQVKFRGGHCGPDELGCSPEFQGFLFDPHRNGAGALNDYAGYGATLCVWFLGSPNSVAGMAGRLLKTHLAVDDNAVILLRYPRAMCVLEMTWTEAVAHRPAHDLAIYGTQGTMVVPMSSREGPIRLFTRENREGADVAADPLPPGEANGPERFLGAVRERRWPDGICNPDLSRQAQEIMEAGLLAARTGTAIALPLEDHLFRH
jgi:predicted dehydrogenase